MITNEQLQQPMKLQVGDKLFVEGIDFKFDENGNVTVLKQPPPLPTPKKWWQFWKKDKPIRIDFKFD